MSIDLPFLLHEGEELIKDASVMQYFGVGIINVGFGAGGISSSGIAGGIMTSKQQKREKSIFDATNCHVYLTSKRIIFVKAYFNLSVSKEKSLENIFSDIPLEHIEGIYPSTKLMMHTTIDLSVKSPDGTINKISFAFLDSAAGIGMKRYKRAQERDEFIAAIEEQRKRLFNSKQNPLSQSSVKSDEDPIKLLKIRYAKGEISKEEYEEMKSLLDL
jgi:hypothetical protein